MADTTPEAQERSLKERVSEIIEAIRPAIQGDGGDIELIDVDASGVVQLRLHGACVGCPSSTMTLAMGIERNLKERIPEVSEVVCV
jgi:Fe-S cluster biogenesis protein NfuA